MAMMFGSDNRMEDPYDSSKFDYDDRGNQTVIGGAAITLEYDGENRQASYTVDEVSRELYSYDGEGRRVLHERKPGIDGAFPPFLIRPV
jgi:hypothetical protein